ncbi:alanine racemase [Glaciecola siphonariae]|uniref:Alanine racemase n=1 Tax=Glaciecola siphonariae TaxID=521012 RepID=A0ABV9LZJ6_9ALTE
MADSQSDTSFYEARSLEIFEKGAGCKDVLSTDGWHLLKEEVSLPIAVLNIKDLNSNARWMQAFSEKAKVKLAPHGKTTMAPTLFHQQLEQGCWGISLATVAQVHNAFVHGIKRIIMANQLVGKYHMNAIAELLATGELDFYCFVDSVQNIHALGEFFTQRNLDLNILIEVGVEHGRCGWRDADNITPLLEAIRLYPRLKLSGLSFYEGVIHSENAQAMVSDFVERICALFARLYHSKHFSLTEPILTGAGSAWYDLVSDIIVSSPALQGIDLTAIIRPGCYLIHDKGIYQDAQNQVLGRSQIACDLKGDLVSSLTVWAYVHSVPESGFAIVGAGKRDFAFDAGFPKPEWVYRPTSDCLALRPTRIDQHCEVIKVMDQHCMISFDTTLSLAPGDMVCFSTSHPCLTMDKWRYIALIDEDFVVRKTIETFF